jgi:hypothetical protein
MNNRGLLIGYKVNRLKSPDEIDGYLPQQKRSGSKPWYMMSVVRMNSTYLEVIDKFFMTKGIVSFFCGICVTAFLWHMISLFAFECLSDRPCNPDLFYFAINIVLLPVLVFLGHHIIKDAFQYTHYPIRFNRKTRMVHFFRTDGTVVSRPWDHIFFTLARLDGRGLEVRALIMDHFQHMVLDVIPLSFYGHEDDRFLLYQWEFIRRYMEEPDELPRLADQVELIPIPAGRKEGFWRGFTTLFATNKGLVLFTAPLMFLFSFGRAFAMFFSKIPRWPDYVEAESHYSLDDPYLRDEDHRAPCNRMTPPWMEK